ncbi:MAG: tRNA 2-selenouridine(34) synthase MnmH [Ferruginibacter sp.]
MSVKKILIEEFFELAQYLPVFDVRSPGEYNHAQIPGAYSLPLFSDEERKVVGTAYKQQGKQKAIKFGLDYFGVKMKEIVEEVENIVKVHKQELLTSVSEQVHQNRIIVHCWRGGMRSGAVSWLLDLYGFEVYILVGGYKAYRNWVISQFEKDYNFKILGGYTGSGKTTILHQLENNNQLVVDLEKLANHKGSAFGGIGQGEQPTQEMFENLLAADLNKHQQKPIWLEDESQRIGRLHIPHPLWNTMRAKPVYFVDIPFHERLIYIEKEYGICDKEQLQESIERIQKRLGPLETKTAIEHLQKDEIAECFGILLLYYDKHYKKGLQNRDNIDKLLNKIPCLSVDSIVNAKKLHLCNTESL